MPVRKTFYSKRIKDVETFCVVWERLVEQQGVAYVKTVAEAMNLRLDMDNPADARDCAEQFWILSPGEKCESKKGTVEILSFT